LIGVKDRRGAFGLLVWKSELNTNSKGKIKMKKYLLVLSLIFASLTVNAQALDTPDQARKVKNNISDQVFGLPRVHGLGITGCDPRTGERLSTDRRFVHCVQINTDSQETLDYLQELFPPGRKVQGVFVIIQLSERPSIQPRSGFGN
jgi:hypothetical protein